MKNPWSRLRLETVSGSCGCARFDGLEIKFLPSTNGMLIDATISEEVGQIS